MIALFPVGRVASLMTEETRRMTAFHPSKPEIGRVPPFVGSEMMRGVFVGGKFFGN